MNAQTIPMDHKTVAAIAEADKAKITTPKPKREGKLHRWIRERLTRAGRQDREARDLSLRVQKALSDPKSKVGIAVTAVAHTMAQGMVARWMDDRGVLRCAHCLTTGSLRFKGKTREGKKVYVCEVHADKMILVLPLPKCGSIEVASAVFLIEHERPEMLVDPEYRLNGGVMGAGNVYLFRARCGAHGEEINGCLAASPGSPHDRLMRVLSGNLPALLNGSRL